MEYKYQHQTFIITPQKIIIETRLQRFYLSPINHKWRKHLNFVRALIELGEIRTYNDLVHYCRDKIEILPTHDQPKVPINYGVLSVDSP